MYFPLLSCQVDALREVSLGNKEFSGGVASVDHLFPFRTQKLSTLRPTILGR